MSRVGLKSDFLKLHVGHDDVDLGETEMMSRQGWEVAGVW